MIVKKRPDPGAAVAAPPMAVQQFGMILLAHRVVCALTNQQGLCAVGRFIDWSL